jgi:hypothetical protein
MQQNSNYTLLYPNKIDWESFQQIKADTPFSDSVLEYLNALSTSLLHDRESRLYPDVVTFAFFCRKANLLKLKDIYAKDNNRLGRGILFHVAPSNVPINFGYSLVAGVLAGNNNIVRVSSKDFPQVNLIIRHMHDLSSEYGEISSRIALVRYDRSSDATDFFSSFCNVRVIWGGDNTIDTIRKSQIPPRSFDVCFADRYSIAAIRPQAIIDASEPELAKLAESFYNDTYLFDQNACSAPHVIFWENTSVTEQAKSRFWTAVHDYTAQKYNLQAVLSVDKLTAFYRQSVLMDIKSEAMPDNYVVRTRLSQLPKNIDSFRCAGGYFSEYGINSLDDIASIVTAKYQTLAYYGFEKAELTRFVTENKLFGLDRIVPIGETTAFSLTWDGYNLIDTFTRIQYIL